MKSIDLTPLYRSSIGFDRLGSLLDSALSADTTTSGYPPYDIEMLDENRYAIVLAVAGFKQSELEINVEKGMLTISGEKADDNERKYLHHGISNSTFERKFNLADYVEVTSADLSNGLLTINLTKEIPEEMKPKTIAINQHTDALDHVVEETTESKTSHAA